jgi:integrase
LSDEQLLALLAMAKEDCFRNYVMILVTYWHMLRASETCNLRHRDIDLKAGTIHIVRGKGSDGGDHDLGSWPDNPLLDERTALERWLGQRRQFGLKGGANPEGRKRLAKTLLSTEIVKSLPQEARLQGCSEQKPAAGPEPLPDPPGAALGPFPPPHTPSERLFPIGRVRFWQIVNGYLLAIGVPRRKCKPHTLKHTMAKHLVRAGHDLSEIQEYAGWTTIETMNWYTRADEEELCQRIGDTIRHKQGLRPVRQGLLFTSDPS